MLFTRRDLLKSGLSLYAGAKIGLSDIAVANAVSRHARSYDLTLSSGLPDASPELLSVLRDAGVSTLWLVTYSAGNWCTTVEKARELKDNVTKMGFKLNPLNIPLGHPGPPSNPAPFGEFGVRPDGSLYRGVSIHGKAKEENVDAIRQLKSLNSPMLFVDDDFRLGLYPGVIGGCFCEKHRGSFCKRYGYGDTQWNGLLLDVKNRQLTEVLRNWVDYTCDELTDFYRAMQTAAAPEVTLGIMVMWMGSEKAGIRLTDYADMPFRVGELMFTDAAFAPVKGKTNELFGSLFHRRFVKPQNAYSESTAAPSDKLSGTNMAAKLAVSTISDVRTTMFMGSWTTFPISYWQTISPAMKKNAAIHDVIAGHKLKGPFKHYWGIPSRYVGDDNPYSLFLAAGVPFEVTDKPASDGWTFLSDADACAVNSKQIKSAGTTLVYRPEARVNLNDGRQMPESMSDLFAFKRKIMPYLSKVPYVEEEIPTVCAWYPTAHAVVLWNLTEEKQTLAVNYKGKRRYVKIDPLGIELLKDVIYAD